MYYHNILLKEFKRIYTNGICHKNLLLEMLLTKVQFIVIAFSKSSAHLGWDVTTLCNPKKKDSLDIVTSALIITLTTITAKTKKKKKCIPCLVPYSSVLFLTDALHPPIDNYCLLFVGFSPVVTAVLSFLVIFLLEAYSREQALIVQRIASEHNSSDFVFTEDPQAKKELWKV